MGILNCDEAKGVSHRREHWPKRRVDGRERTAHSGCCTAKCPDAYRYGAGSFDGNSTRCTPTGSASSDAADDLLNTRLEAIMAITEVFTHNQPLGNSDPAHTAYGLRTDGFHSSHDAAHAGCHFWQADRLDGAHAGAAMGIGCNRRPEQRGTGILQIWLFPY